MLICKQFSQKKLCKTQKDRDKVKYFFTLIPVQQSWIFQANIQTLVHQQFYPHY